MTVYNNVNGCVFQSSDCQGYQMVPGKPELLGKVHQTLVNWKSEAEGLINMKGRQNPLEGQRWSLVKEEIEKTETTAFCNFSLLMNAGEICAIAFYHLGLDNNFSSFQLERLAVAPSIINCYGDQAWQYFGGMLSVETQNYLTEIQLEAEALASFVEGCSSGDLDGFAESAEDESKSRKFVLFTLSEDEASDEEMGDPMDVDP